MLKVENFIDIDPIFLFLRCFKSHRFRTLLQLLQSPLFFGDLVIGIKSYFFLDGLGALVGSRYFWGGFAFEYDVADLLGFLKLELQLLAGEGWEGLLAVGMGLGLFKGGVFGLEMQFVFVLHFIRLFVILLLFASSPAILYPHKNSRIEHNSNHDED